MLIDKAIAFAGADKGTMFALYLCQHANPHTKIFSRSYKQIQDDLGISQVSIAKYFKLLEESNLITRAGDGKWRIHAVVQGSETCDGPEWYVTSRR